MARKATRAAQGAGTIRKKTVTSKGKQYTYWEARITIGRDPGTGKQLQKSFSGKTQKEVREKMQAAAAELAAGTYTEPSKLTVAQWSEVWLNEYCNSIKPTTKATYQSIFGNYINPVLGAIKLSSLATHVIQTLYNDLYRGSGAGKKLSAATLSNVNAVMCASLAQAVKLGYIRANPAANCTLPRKEKREMSVLDEEQTRQFLQEIKGHQYETLFIVALFTGMRKGELLGLTWDCVDFTNGVLNVNKQMQNNRLTGKTEFMTPKRGNGRKITPAPWVMQVLRKHQIKQAESRLLAGPMWQDNNLVFTNAEGRHLIAETVYSGFKHVAKNIGCPNLRFHDLRHSYAVASIRAGDDVKTLQENLGHASAAMTLDVYSHATEQMKQDSADRMDGYIKSVLNL